MDAHDPLKGFSLKFLGRWDKTGVYSIDIDIAAIVCDKHFIFRYDHCDCWTFVLRVTAILPTLENQALFVTTTL